MISHIAITLDGNRRWARKRGWPKFLGHREGAKRIDDIAKYCLDHGVKYLSLYVFSIENFKRSLEEKSYLFDLLNEFAKQKLPLFLKHGIKIQFSGDRTLFPDKVKAACEMLERETASQTKLIINLLFCYGGQQEIVAAAKSCLERIQRGELDPDALNVETFSQHLWSGQMPPPEIIVRTGGVKRLSNCLLFHAAYSELFFTDTLWPDFTEKDLDEIVEQYESIKRNFGK
jgi:undecaprenyl diphosphate synthase